MTAFQIAQTTRATATAGMRVCVRERHVRAAAAAYADVRGRVAGDLREREDASVALGSAFGGGERSGRLAAFEGHVDGAGGQAAGRARMSGAGAAAAGLGCGGDGCGAVAGGAGHAFEIHAFRAGGTRYQDGARVVQDAF